MFRYPKKKKAVAKKVQLALMAERRSKYGNKKIFDPQHGWFDSKLEYHVYLFLLRVQNRGDIHDLQRQVEIEVLPACTYYKFKQLIKKFRFDVHHLRPMRYIADFTYYDKDGRYHVCDAKGRKTKEYVMKKKALLALKGIYIEEWSAKDLDNLIFNVDMGFNQDTDITVKPWMPPKSIKQI